MEKLVLDSMESDNLGMKAWCGNACEGPLHCPVWDVKLTKHWAELCRTRPEYRALYSAGKGPGQRKEHTPSKPTGPIRETTEELKPHKVRAGCGGCGGKGKLRSLFGMKKPSQDKPDMLASPTKGKPGTILHGMIERWTGETPNLSCKCMQWIRKMDREGPQWCRDNVDLITAKLYKEAAARAPSWKAAPVDENGTILNAVVKKVWAGAFIIPGLGVSLMPFIKQMVLEAIRQSEA